MPTIRVALVDYSGLPAPRLLTDASGVLVQWNAYYSSVFSGLPAPRTLTDASGILVQWNSYSSGFIGQSD